MSYERLGGRRVQRESHRRGALGFANQGWILGEILRVLRGFRA